MADHGQAFEEVLAWVREVTEDSPTLQPIPGISASELRQLARLGALLKSRLTLATPTELADALTTSPAILPDTRAYTAFDLLLKEDVFVKLADLYAAIVRPANRRTLGTFFTPRPEATAIVEGYASRHDAPAEVVDVGAGVGIFSEVARAKWPSATIRAIDINPVTLGLQAVAAVGRPEWNVSLELADYRCWLAAKPLSDPVLYLGNPPYTRWQLLAESDRASLLADTGGLVGARANLSTLFLAITLKKLRSQDSLAMIIPAGWMRAEYGKKLRAHLRGATDRQISLRMADNWRFDEAIVDAVLVEVGPVAASPQSIEVSDWSGSEKLSLSREGGEAAFPAPGRSVVISRAANSGDVELGELARITRGVASGANAFFVRKAHEWDALNIAQQYRRALARRLRPGVGASSPALETSELLVLGDYESGSCASVESWIKAGEVAGVDSGHLCGKRPRWFDLSAEVKAPDVIIAALAHDAFHVIENPDGLAIMNNLFGLHWKPGIDPAARSGIVAWLRSAPGQAALRASASVEANGLHRLSPKAAGAIVVPGASRTAGGADLGLAELVPVGRRSR